MSRIKDDFNRKLGGHPEGFVNPMWIETEAKALQEFRWLKNHNAGREYLLFSVDDKLYDELPF